MTWRDLAQDYTITLHLALGSYLWLHDASTIAPGVFVFMLGAWHAYGNYVEPALKALGVIETPIDELPPEDVELEVERQWLKQIKESQSYQPKKTDGKD